MGWRPCECWVLGGAAAESHLENVPLAKILVLGLVYGNIVAYSYFVNLALHGPNSHPTTWKRLHLHGKFVALRTLNHLEGSFAWAQAGATGVQRGCTMLLLGYC